MGAFLFFVLTFLVSFPALAVDLGLTGYYRFRTDLSHDLDTQTPNTSITHDNDRFGVIQYNQMRLRLNPSLKVNDNLSVHTEFDLLDNLLFGTSANKNLQILSPVVGTLTLPSGAGTIGEVGGAASENGSAHIRRAWMDILTPIGKFKLGRQPSHWGLGIFQNDGSSRQSDFGDNADRVLFLTQAPMKNGSALTFGGLWDIPFEAGPDPRVQGLGGTVRDNGQDAKQFAGILYYDHNDWALGTFSGIRMRSGSNGTTTTALDARNNTVATGIDGDTLAYFGDIYGKYTNGPYTFQFEGVYVGGKISTGLALNAIPFSSFSSSGSGAGIIQLPAKQTLQVMMAAFEATGIYDWGGEWSAKTGYASGDATPLSTKITQYGFRPDYQIALLMFNKPLGTSPSLFGGTASNPAANSRLTGGVPITGNFINNALYLSTGYKHRFDMRDVFSKVDWFKFGGVLTTAWAPKRNVNLDFADLLSNTNLPSLTENNNSFFKRWYGAEADLLAEASFFKNLYTVFELGLLFPGKAYNIDVTETDPGSIIDPIPSDKASFALGGRFTAMVEF